MKINVSTLMPATAFVILTALIVATTLPDVARAVAPNPVSPQPSGVGLTKSHTATTASTNCKLVVAGPHVLYEVWADNTNAAAQYLKFFDKATAPVAGTDTPSGPILPLATNVPQNIANLQFGIQFVNGIGICSTAAIADADATNATVGASIDLGYK